MNINSISANSFVRRKQDPNAYAQQYANQKGLSLEDAKTELKSQFGDPKEGANIPYIGQGNQSSIFSNQISSNSLNSTSSIGSVNGSSYSFGLSGVSSTNQTQGMDPDKYAEQYAEEKGISLEEAKAELKALYGEPKKLDFLA